MGQDYTFHIEHFTIRANEVDQSGSLTLQALCALFQEVAGNNAKDLNFDITDLRSQNITWVLHRMDIEIHELPMWREDITIETWPATGDRLRAYRNYKVLNQYGKVIINCLSYWMLMDLTTRRPMRLPAEITEMRLTDRPHVVEEKSTRLRPFEGENEQTIYVRRADTDMNQHVNNARYVEWMLETIPAKKATAIQSFDIIFMQESNEGERLKASSSYSGKDIKFQLINENDKVIALAEATT
jgi:acyl-ACP thioesterase